MEANVKPNDRGKIKKRLAGKEDVTFRVFSLWLPGTSS
jgi:hypothetical protein